MTPSKSYHRIRSLDVRSGFLDNMRLEFDGGLNCIIGGRGTGKTTAIELIRYALGEMPDSKKFSDLSKELTNSFLATWEWVRYRFPFKPKTACSILLIVPTMSSYYYQC